MRRCLFPLKLHLAHFQISCIICCGKRVISKGTRLINESDAYYAHCFDDLESVIENSSDMGHYYCFDIFMSSINWPYHEVS